METEINLPFITADQNGPKHLMVKLSRSKLEQMVLDLVERSIGPCQKALSDAGLAARDIDEVVLVGGMRDDVVTKDYAREDILKNAPESDGAFFIVPRIV